MELLKQLFAIHSPSGKEFEMRAFVKSWVRQNVPGCSIKGDQYGNMYIRKGNANLYPCVVAHLDQVQRPYPNDYQVLESNGILFGWSQSQRSRKGLGGDDKCGIWIALNILLSVENVKVAFFAAEETGCQGSSRCDMSFFDDTMYIIEPDRRGHSDLITEIGFGNICSKEFIDAIDYESYGYAPTSGLMTDVESLVENGYPNSCINLSCGYYEPHTDNEFVVWADLINAFAFVWHIVEKIDKPYPNDNFSYWDEYDRFIDEYEEDVKLFLDDMEYDKGYSADAICDDIYDSFWGLGREELLRIINEWKSEK